MHISEYKNYLELERQYSSHTSESYLRDLEQFAEFLKANDTNLENAHYSMVRQWMATLVEQEVSARSINRKMSSLKSYFKFLRNQGYVDHNIMSQHKSLTVSKKIQIPFSQKEVGELLSADYDLSSFNEVRDRAVIELLYVSGIRRAELLGLSISRVDLESNKLKVLGKRNKERVVPLMSSTVKILKQYLNLRESVQLNDVDVFFLTEKGKPIYASLVYRIVNGYFKRVSLKTKVSPHVLRHTFATHLLDQGADLNAIKELLGHASLASTQVYTHTSMQALKNVHASAHPRNKK
ncbi:integrase/recombinase XerC [Nonlabens sp. Hel1_33_55]|uniref:tyrosine-type recombinase/integrase n=1 Tax=Nonlabens sp. Hel1_33_55 TaxID=1336802 RepID=UPI000875BC7F|nr:tyrosine-type recombinase/integrase [Nonlabens sp. Hel1_33_55]SCY45159.1 integrase/recombinase XerC [Nonlabens sp. Hel1_33_55]